MTRTEEIAHIVLATLDRDFENIKVTDVSVSPDLDRDGDEIIRIDVIYDGEPKKPDTRLMLSAPRRLRAALEQIDVQEFPLLSFISSSDYRARKNEFEAA